MSMFEKSEFKFSETFNNSDGKSSGSAFVGVWLGLIGGIGFIAGTFGYFFDLPDTMEYLGFVMKLIFAASILMGARKVVGQIVNGKKKNDSPAPTVTTPVVNEDLG